MTAKVKQFIEENIELIEQGKFREIYYKVIFNWDFKDVKELENILLQADILQGQLSNYFTFRFLILKGSSNTGKTSTLKRLIKIMIGDPDFRLFDCSQHFWENLDNYHFDPNKSIPDVWAKFCYNGTHITITTRGDSPTDIISEFDKLKFGTDIFVCPCHDTPLSQDALKKLGAGNDDFANKVTIPNKNDDVACKSANNTQAHDLLNQIKKMIN